MTKNPLMRRFIWTHLILSLGYVASVALASWFIPDDAEPSLTVIIFAAFPGVMVVGWIWNMGRLYLTMEDEFLRMLEVRKAMWATAIALGICGGWGLIELFASVPRLPVFFVVPIWCLGLIAGHLINRFTHGTGGGSLW
ncbi:MAG: hypothetical protein ABJ205_08480 [Erythrobacter sp.]|uniref:hypothetical protein n=1 Tax=Erythrobacter sp. TaxID=1042 RepID=UPI003267B939